MTDSTCPMTSKAVVDRYFLEHRAKLLDLAAFLDRVDRAGADGDGTEDFRVAAMRRAIAELAKDGAGRARRIHEVFSDQSTEPIDKAPITMARWTCAPGISLPKAEALDLPLMVDKTATNTTAKVLILIPPAT